MPVYSDSVMDHFRNPRNMGQMEDADGIGEAGNSACGDVVVFYARIQDSRLSRITFKTVGCGPAIAVSSFMTEMAAGKTLEEARQITPSAVAEALGGLPENKLHCPEIGVQALNNAIDDYLGKT